MIFENNKNEEKKITSKERVLKAIAHEEVDRVPIENVLALFGGSVKAGNYTN